MSSWYSSIHYLHLFQLARLSLCLVLPVLDKQQLEMISSQAHLAALLQSLEASLKGNEAEGPVGGKRVARRRGKKRM